MRVCPPCRDPYMPGHLCEITTGDDGRPCDCTYVLCFQRRYRDRLRALAEYEGWWAMIPYNHGERRIVWAKGHRQAREITGLKTRSWGVRPAAAGEIESWPRV